MKNKIIFAVGYTLLLALGVFTVYKNIVPGQVYTPFYIANMAQRIFGLTIYTMLFVQIILGFFMQKLTEKFGGWIFKFHIFQGTLIYALILSHVASFILYNYLGGKGFDPFYAVVDICILCDPFREYYLTLGRLGLWFATTTVATALLRAQTPFLRLNWRKFHYLNYVIFLFGGIHSIGVGTDIGKFPYLFFHGPALIIVAGLGIFKLYGFFKNFKWSF